jgi:hypothetical protein
MGYSYITYNENRYIGTSFNVLTRCTLFSVCAMCYLLSDLTDVLDSIIKALSRNLVVRTTKETPHRRNKVESAIIRKDGTKKLFCVETAAKNKKNVSIHLIGAQSSMVLNMAGDTELEDPSSSSSSSSSASSHPDYGRVDYTAIQNDDEHVNSEEDGEDFLARPKHGVPQASMRG